MNPDCRICRYYKDCKLRINFIVKLGECLKIGYKKQLEKEIRRKKDEQRIRSSKRY